MGKYRAAVGLLPDHTGIRVNYAVALLRLGQWQQGLAKLREAVRREPGNALWKAALDDALRQGPWNSEAGVRTESQAKRQPNTERQNRLPCGRSRGYILNKSQ